MRSIKPFRAVPPKETPSILSSTVRAAGAVIVPRDRAAGLTPAIAFDDEEVVVRSPYQILSEAPSEAWRPLDPENMLVVDLPARLRGRLDDQLRRLVAHARRVGARLVVLEPPTIAGPLQAALAGSTGLRLELERRSWLRLGRDVVGQRTAVAVAKNRYGPPGRSVDLDIHYLTEGERSLATHRLIVDEVAGGPALEPFPFEPRPVGQPAPRLVVV